MSRPVSGYASALTALVESGVRFVVGGVGGINFYAREPSGAFATLDLDVLLGASFPELAGDATSFRVGSVEAPVGRLERLLDSNQASGRAKDLEFLRAFRARSGEDVGE